MATSLASVGPATGFLGALASSIGTGMVVGGFAGGVLGFLTVRPRAGREEDAIEGSYLGGAGGLLALLFDTLTKPIV